MDDPPLDYVCTHGVASGSLCPRPAEVLVRFVDLATGATSRRDELCPVHAFAALGVAFRNVDYLGKAPMTVIVSPLP